MHGNISLEREENVNLFVIVFLLDIEVNKMSKIDEIHISVERKHTIVAVVKEVEEKKKFSSMFSHLNDDGSTYIIVIYLLVKSRTYLYLSISKNLMMTSTFLINKSYE